MNASEIEKSLADRRTNFFESQNGLFYLANQTGGFALVNDNDLAGGIKRVIEDQKRLLPDWISPGRIHLRQGIEPPKIS